jgi:two-component system cell cycle response regulator CpdR
MKSILIAEDEPSMLSFLVWTLESQGYSVDGYENGKLAHEALQKKSYDLLLTDIIMPEMDGVELSQNAQKLHPKMKIMFVTGFAGMAPTHDTKTTETTITKPFHLKELVERVNILMKE